MSAQSPLRRLVATVVLVSAVLGCKGGGSGVLGRKDSLADAKRAGPSLGAPTRLSSNRAGTQPIDHPEHVAYRTATNETTSAAPVRPQLTCPVEGRQLGAAGTPVTVTLKGEPIFVCSQACARKAQKDPDKYLSRVRNENAAHR